MKQWWKCVKWSSTGCKGSITAEWQSNYRETPQPWPKWDQCDIQFFVHQSQTSHEGAGYQHQRQTQSDLRPSGSQLQRLCPGHDALLVPNDSELGWCRVVRTDVVQQQKYHPWRGSEHQLVTINCSQYRRQAFCWQHLDHGRRVGTADDERSQCLRYVDK
jgi:hypothetical protein